VDVGGLRFTVMLTRGGAVRWFRVARVAMSDGASEGGDVD
jgi:magnesium and cobalt transporter